MGEWNTSSEIDCIRNICADPVVDIPVGEVIVYDSYDENSRSREYDIAIVKMATRLHEYTGIIQLLKCSNPKKAG